MTFLTFAHSSEPRISYIIIVKSNNLTYGEVHFPTDANRKYVLQGIDSLSASNKWTNLHTYFASPATNHYVYHDGLTNKARFFRLLVTP